MSKPLINILNVNMSIDPVSSGGTGERTLQMSKALCQEGNKCSILTLDIGNLTQVSQDLAVCGVGLVRLSCWSRRFYLPSLNFMKIFRMVKNADIVHLMGHWTVLNAMVYVVTRFCNKPYVVCPAGALPLFGRSQGFKKVYNALIGRRIIRNARVCIAITDDEKSQFVPYGIDSTSIAIIHNGISPADFISKDVVGVRARYGLGEKPFLLFVGRLNYIKGPDLLLEAYLQLSERLAQYNLVFVGPDGGMQQALIDTAKKRGVEDRVFFLGYLGGEEKSNIYHAADFLVIPSRQEAMSIVVLEAGICSTAVLLTEECGFNEVAAQGGGVVVGANVEGLKDGLVEMLGRENLKMVGDNLFRLVSERYTWRDVGSKLDRVLKSNVN